MITIKIWNDETHPEHPRMGNYVYIVRIKDEPVFEGRIEDHPRQFHSAVLIEKVVEDMKGRLHEQRTGR